MAKSTRSKVKRQWRAKKREDSVYAVTEAARLHRLSQKLKNIAQTDADGDIGVGDVDMKDKDEVQDEMEGSSWFDCLGVLHHEDITPERLELLSSMRRETSDSGIPDSQLFNALLSSFS
jgi:hypothetical protein